jgi:hypothetical protein
MSEGTNKIYISLRKSHFENQYAHVFPCRELRLKEALRSATDSSQWNSLKTVLQSITALKTLESVKDTTDDN